MEVRLGLSLTATGAPPMTHIRWFSLDLSPHALVTPETAPTPENCAFCGALATGHLPEGGGPHTSGAAVCGRCAQPIEEDEAGEEG